MDFHSGRTANSRPLPTTSDPSHTPLLVQQNIADDAFNPRYLVDDHPEKYNGAKKPSRKLPTGTMSTRKEGSRHSAIPFTARMSALLIAIGSLLLGLSVLLWLLHRYHNFSRRFVTVHQTILQTVQSFGVHCSKPTSLFRHLGSRTHDTVGRQSEWNASSGLDYLISCCQ